MQKAASAYLQTNVSTTSPGELIILLYDGAIKFLTRAKVLIDTKDFAGKGVAISKTLDILNELSSVLNKEKGGELAENLNKLYFWCTTKLAMANLKLDKDAIDSVIKVLSGLRSAYAQIQSMPEVQAVSAQLSASQNTDHFVQRNLPAAESRPEQIPATINNNLRGRAAYSKMASNFG